MLHTKECMTVKTLSENINFVYSEQKMCSDNNIAILG